MEEKWEKGEVPQALVVDARALHVSGLGRYLREILGRLLVDSRFAPITLIGDATRISEFVEEVSPPTRPKIVAFPDGFYTPRTSAAWLGLKMVGRIPGDVHFFPHYDVPVVGMPTRSVVTVHDLIHFKVPELFGGWRRRIAGWVLDRAVEQASCVIAVSEATRRDLLDRCPSAGSKVVVVLNGHSSHLATSSGSRPAGLRQGRFLLCVGNQKPHKNQIAAVEAFALLRPEHPDLGLVIVGRRFPKEDRLGLRIQELGVHEAVVRLDEVGDPELAWLYDRAEALVFPSLYEGFGLPILEAMAAGTPVVASNRSSIPEVVGDAGMLFEPHDYPALAGQLRIVLGDSRRRAELVDRGRQRAATFQWDDTASRTADLLYGTAIGRAPRPGAVRPAVEQEVTMELGR